MSSSNVPVKKEGANHARPSPRRSKCNQKPSPSRPHQRTWGGECDSNPSSSACRFARPRRASRILTMPSRSVFRVWWALMGMICPVHRREEGQAQLPAMVRTCPPSKARAIQSSAVHTPTIFTTPPHLATVHVQRAVTAAVHAKLTGEHGWSILRRVCGSPGCTDPHGRSCRF